jgi:hypothetical protein
MTMSSRIRSKCSRSRIAEHAVDRLRRCDFILVSVLERGEEFPQHVEYGRPAANAPRDQTINGARPRTLARRRAMSAKLPAGRATAGAMASGANPVNPRRRPERGGAAVIAIDGGTSGGEQIVFGLHAATFGAPGKAVTLLYYPRLWPQRA